MELNKIYNESNIETMAKMPDNFIDLTVTSPPKPLLVASYSPAVNFDLPLDALHPLNTSMMHKEVISFFIFIPSTMHSVYFIKYIDKQVLFLYFFHWDQ